ncbi:MAG: ABC transporter ATP-binding protein [Tistlia sp.]|uniref:ABC transporter ATP-binding protein n=1 Tax=Tistlia sp. TaxID=3057121 RepID=UPI0034A36B83
MLRLEELQVVRGRTRVLHGLTLELGAGEIAALVGANGAGKTTTLMALSGLLPIACGRATLELESGTLDVARSTPAALVAGGLIHCPEGRQVFARLTIEENLRLGAYLNRDEAEVRRLLGEAYALFPVLGERRGLNAGGLSGGEQMMLAVARALMAQPKVLLLDEPSLGLAPQITERIFDTLVELNRERGVAMLIVEQNAMLALEIAHKGFVMEEGRIVMSGTGRALLEDAGVVQAYLGASA